MQMTSMMSINSCLSLRHQLMLLLLPVPKSTMRCLLRWKNMTVTASYSSYILLKSGTCGVGGGAGAGVSVAILSTHIAPHPPR